MNKQIDIWGNEHEIKNIVTKKKRKSIKEKFRDSFGYDENNICGDCDKFMRLEYHNRTYFKCPELGLSHSEATDIRKSDKACRLFKDK